MKKIILILLLVLPCYANAEIISESRVTGCPQDYNPVCSYDGKTYLNMCYFETIIKSHYSFKYEGVCMDNNSEDIILDTINKFEKNVLNAYEDYEKALFYENIINKIDNLNVYTYDDARYSIYSYIKMIFGSKAGSIYSDYIFSNINDIIKTEKKGKEWYNTFINWEGRNKIFLIYTSRGTTVGLEIDINPTENGFDLNVIEKVLE